MKNRNPNEQRATGRRRLVTCATVLGAVLTAALPSAAQIETLPETRRAHSIDVPPVPAILEVEAPNEVVFVGHAIGTQNYVCLPTASGGVDWALFTPQATLFRKRGQQLTTHFFSPNPEENGIVRAAWQHSHDSSTVWGRAIQSSSDPNFVAPGAIPWLLVQKTGVQAGPLGSGQLTRTTFIQRLNTVGGVAPATGCSVAADIGKREFVPYRADYFFYENPRQR